MEKMLNTRLIETGDIEDYNRIKYEEMIRLLMNKGITAGEIKKTVIEKLIGTTPAPADIITIESIINKLSHKN